MEGTRDGRTANLSGEPVDSVHPAAPSTTDNKTEDKK
jgi:carbamoyl-phosphate synthase small subunit